VFKIIALLSVSIALIICAYIAGNRVGVDRIEATPIPQRWQARNFENGVTCYVNRPDTNNPSCVYVPPATATPEILLVPATVQVYETVIVPEFVIVTATPEFNASAAHHRRDR